jgi:hypothetical protein
MFDELADGVFRRRYESLDLNVGVVIGEEGALIIDTRASHVEADELLDELGTLTSCRCDGSSTPTGTGTTPLATPASPRPRSGAMSAAGKSCSIGAIP